MNKNQNTDEHEKDYKKEENGQQSDHYDHTILGVSYPWLQAIGVILSAIGGTPINILSKDFLFAMNVGGDIFQIMANALQADVIEQLDIWKLSNQVQTIGNGVEIVGELVPKDFETMRTLINNGNTIQAMGNSLILFTPSNGNLFNRIMDFYGNLFQVVGLVLSVIGGVQQLEDYNTQNREENKDVNQNQDQDQDKSLSTGEILEISGGWVQAIGAVMSALVEDSVTDHTGDGAPSFGSKQSTERHMSFYADLPTIYPNGP